MDHIRGAGHAYIGVRREMLKSKKEVREKIHGVIIILLVFSWL